MPEKIKLYLQSLRLERWPRSLAIIPGFIGVFILHPDLIKQVDTVNILLKLVLGFILTWFISTANYIVNEITDAPYDKYHPQKKHRPLIRNQISITKLILLYLVLVLVSIIAGITLYNPNFLFSLLALLAAGIIYNVPPVRMKDIPFLDSTVESANNPIRFLIGWYIITTSFPPLSLLVSWWCFGNFLMIGKRVAEKKFLTEAESAGYRLSLKKYSPNMLIFFMLINAIIFIVTFSLFAIESEFYTLLFSLPFIIIYLFMFVKKSLKDPEGAEELEKLLKNPHFAIYTLFLVIIFIIAFICK
ncbi:MAG: UbiA family prenyltransferase [Candidatus Aminicenantes bacterium]|nr:UbiA family prenyltransferase [Candidatus Aminicenantes bacterium]